MSTPAHIKGHPLHPILVPLPIGLWVFSLACDIVYRFASSDAVWEAMAFYTMAGGVVGALAAALPGFIDFLSISNPSARRIAFTHMLINLSLVAVYSINLWLRTTTSDSSLPILLSAMGVVLLGVSGWLGGELVFRHGIGSSRDRPSARTGEGFPSR